MKFNDYWRLTIWFLLTCFLLFIPASQLPTEPFLRIPHLDKIVHFSLFFILCLLLFRPVKKFTPNYYFWTPLVAICLAVMLESVQHKISVTRQSDVLDLWANVAGLLSATFLFRLFISGKKLEKYL